MSPEELKQTHEYKVVLNHEEQYSIWPLNRPNPPGWLDAGVDGPKERCLAYIDEVWTDMRPRSLREHMSTAAGVPVADSVPGAESD